MQSARRHDCADVPLSPDLLRVVEAWPDFTEAMKTSIMAIVKPTEREVA